jgi:hypothetical protein
MMRGAVFTGQQPHESAERRPARPIAVLIGSSKPTTQMFGGVQEEREGTLPIARKLPSFALVVGPPAQAILRQATEPEARTIPGSPVDPTGNVPSAAGDSVPPGG